MSLRDRVDELAELRAERSEAEVLLDELVEAERRAAEKLRAELAGLRGD